MRRFGTFQIIALQSANSMQLVYEYKFPPSIQQTSRAHWQPQDTTIGTQPLFYANREPLRIAVPELWLDKTETNESIRPDITALFVLQKERTGEGRPPALIVAWGVNRELVVLEEVYVEELMFKQNGDPLRARVSLTFMELQDTVERVTVRVVDDGAAGTGRPRRVMQ
jgi:hypothetical protein